MIPLLVSCLILLLVPSTPKSEIECDICGLWTTIDDETGEEKSVVEIYTVEEKAFGRIVKIFPKEGEDPDPVCTKGPDERKDKKIVGMVIVDGLVRHGNKWGGSKIFDPEKGKEYKCSMWRDGDNLRVRGHVLFFHRTQTWLPAEELKPEASSRTEAEVEVEVETQDDAAH